MKKITQIFKYFIVLAGMLLSQIAYPQNSWNTAAVYDGNSHYATMNSTLNGTTGEMTVEFWINVGASNSSYSIIGKNQFRIMTDLNKIRVQVNGGTLLTSLTKIDSSKWTHVAVSFSDAGNAIRIYLNGSLDNSLTTFSGTLTATNDSLIIGKSIFASNFAGELDEVRIWRTVRTAAEIQNNYKTHLGWYGYSNYDANLVFCQSYDFDVYSPGIYFPYGGDYGAISGDVLGNLPSKTVIHNNSMYFTGSSYLESTSANDPDVSLTGTATFEAWIYPTSIGTDQTILDLTQGGSGGYRLVLTSAGNISWLMNQIGTSNVVLTANKWYHIAVVCGIPSGGNQIASIYINGVYDIGYNYNAMAVNSGKLRIGVNSSTTNYFTGYIDEVRISNYAKTQAEIQRNLHTPILYVNKPVAPNITVAYNFDGNMYSGTRDGNSLKNTGCRFSYASETYSPMFHLGYTHEMTMDSFNIKHPFSPIPTTGTAGYTYDTLKINKSITLDENKIKVFLSLNHSNINDLRVELLSPGGDSVTLIDQIYRPSKEITCVINNQSDQLISGSFNDIAPIIGSENHFTIFNGKNSQGVWKLKVTDLANGNTGVLNSWGLLVDGVPFGSSINEFNMQNSMKLYPNPNSGKFIIDLGGLNITNNKLEIYNVLGDKVFQSELINATSEIDLSSQPKGIYFAKISIGTDTQVKKIVLQ